MHTQRTRMPGYAVAIVSLLITVIAACTTTVPGTPLAEGDNPGGQPSSPATPPVPMARGYEELARIYTAARAVDPCALQDKDAAARITGMVGDAIMPGSNLNSCDLDMAPPGDAMSVWRLSTTVGVTLDAKTARESIPEKVGDTDVLHAPDVLGGDRSCRYLMETNPKPGAPAVTNTPPSSPADASGAARASRTAIELSVRRNSPDAQPKKPCQIAQEYLGQVIKYWHNPALRKDNLTTPRFPVGDVDPCAGLAGVAQPMGGPIEAVLLGGPYKCSVRLTASPDNAEQARKVGVVSATLAVKWDPRLLLANPQMGKDYKPVTVAGRTGTIKQQTSDPNTPKLAGSCTVTLVTDDTVSVHDNLSKADSPKSVQTVETSAATCDLATKAAESVLASIKPNQDKTTPNDKDGDARRAGRTEAVTLGDLDRPPTWKDVGAPFDPCSIAWSEFPDEVRPKDGYSHAPTLKRPGPDVKWTIECTYDNSGAIDAKASTTTGPQGGYLIVTVVWQRDGTADPNKNPGAQPKTWAGRDGFLKPAPDHPRLGQGCMASVRLTVAGAPAGSGALFVSNSRFPQKPACDIADRLAGVIAAKNQ